MVKVYGADLVPWIRKAIKIKTGSLIRENEGTRSGRAKLGQGKPNGYGIRIQIIYKRHRVFDTFRENSVPDKAEYFPKEETAFRIDEKSR